MDKKIIPIGGRQLFPLDQELSTLSHELSDHILDLFLNYNYVLVVWNLKTTKVGETYHD
jgi:hypothetical protein